MVSKRDNSNEQAKTLEAVCDEENLYPTRGIEEGNEKVEKIARYSMAVSMHDEQETENPVGQNLVDGLPEKERAISQGQRPTRENGSKPI